MVHEFNNEEIIVIKKDFKNYIKDFQNCPDLNEILFFSGGYTAGLEMAYGEPLEEIKFISYITNLIMNYFKFFSSENIKLQNTSFQNDICKETFNKVKYEIGVFDLHKFTDLELIKIKDDLKDMINYLRKSYSIEDAAHMLMIQIDGYIKGLEKAYEMPIESIGLINDIVSILHEIIQSEREEVYHPITDEMGDKLWDRIERTLL